MDGNIGKKLDGRYELLELIGVGGMADIYKAHDIVDDKIVAAKILKNEFARSEDFLRRFRNESKAIALLSHQNIVKIYDVGFSDKVQFIVMEHIDGITLTEYIGQQGILKWRDAIHFTMQILRALQHAHDRGIVHRDVKSQNVMLMSDGTIKVMDFGIARFNREADKTISEKAIGSVHYISPEQARGDNTDERSDIYSVGVMLYEMLTGKKPFDGDNPVAIALMHMQSQAKKMTDINNAIPDGLEEITAKAMQKEPSKRYQTAGEMIKDIEEFKKNPSIVFEYKYFSTDSTTKYFNKIENPSDRKNTGGASERMSMRKNDFDDYDDEELDDEYEDYDDEIVERRSPLLPILFAVAAVFVIMTAILIYNIVSSTLLDDPVSNYGEEMKMPNLVGMSYDEAQLLYPNLNLNPTQDYSTEYEKGIIMHQSVSEGRSIKRQQIDIIVSNGAKLITLDDYGNGIRHLNDVIALLKRQGFTNIEPKYQEDENVPNGYVISTDPPARSQLKESDLITLYVSMGSVGQMTTVPDLLGFSKATVEDKCKMYDVIPIFLEEYNNEVEEGRVISQSIDPMTQVEPNTTIEVIMSLGVMPEKTGIITQKLTPGKVKGSYTFYYYIDAVLQEELTETVNMELRDSITWEFTNTGVHTYAIEIESMQTGSRLIYCQYEFDFTVEGNEPKKTELYRNRQVFTELESGVSSDPSPSISDDEPINNDAENVNNPDIDVDFPDDLGNRPPDIIEED